MSDSALSIGLHSVEYYRELKKIGPATDRELQRVERRIEQFERRVDRDMARRLSATQRHVREEMQRMAAAGARANAELNARIERDVATAAARRDAAMLAEHRRREARTAMHARRLEAMEADHQRRLAGLRLLARVPGGGRAASFARFGLASGVGAMAAPLAVGAAGLGVGLMGGAIVTSATRRSPMIQSEWARARKELESINFALDEIVDDSMWWVEGLARSARTGAARMRAVSHGARDARRGVTNTIAALIAGHGQNTSEFKEIDRLRDEARSKNAEHRARMERALAERTIRRNFLGGDDSDAQRKEFMEALNAAGFANSGQGTVMAREYEAIQERARRADEARARFEAEQRRAEAAMVRAGVLGERAGWTETFDDDREAAMAMRAAELEEARVRVLNDEMIPAQERHNRLLLETDAINARTVSRLRAIDDAEEARAKRLEDEQRQREKSILLFQEQLEIEEAVALGEKRRANTLRAEADLRRRLEEIDRLKLEGNARAEAERRAMAIYDAEIAEKKTGARVAGWAGLAGGATLMRQIAGTGTVQSKMLRTSEKMVRVLEQIRDKTGVAVAAP